jgi:hypothetical protein
MNYYGVRDRKRLPKGDNQPISFLSHARSHSHTRDQRPLLIGIVGVFASNARDTLNCKSLKAFIKAIYASYGDS